MSDKNSAGGGFFIGLFLALGIIIAAYLVSDAMKFIKRSNETITVKGYAEKDIVSDMANWSGQYARRSYDLVSGYNTLERDKELVLQYLKKQGFREEQIKFQPVNSYPVYEINQEGRSTNTIVGYDISQVFTVESDNVQLIEKVSVESSELIKQDIGFKSYSPQYTYTKLNDLKLEMLGLATADARSRAETLAENSDSKVGSLKSATQGVFQITSASSTDVSDYGMYDTYSIEKTIKSVVTIEYNIR